MSTYEFNIADYIGKGLNYLLTFRTKYYIIYKNRLYFCAV